MHRNLTSSGHHPSFHHSQYFVFNVLVIIGLLTTMAFCSFLISNDTADFEARCQITLTLTLTIGQLI
jgi:hypothetical protein